MDWSKGYRAVVYGEFVDKNSWKGYERFEIKSGKVRRDSSALRQSADLECDGYERREAWIRIWMDVSQNGASDHVALFTGLATSPKRNIEGSSIRTPVQCFSVLKPAEDEHLLRGWFAPDGIPCNIILKDLLKNTPAPLEFAGEAPALRTPIIAEENETGVTMTDKILNAINWRLKINGKGEIWIGPQAIAESETFDSLSNDCLEPAVDVVNDWFDCPNVFRATRGEESVVARDESEGELSIGSRGREIWKEEASSGLSESESLLDYAQRKLKELQTYAETMTYSRRFIPDVNVTDLVRVEYPKQKLSGVYRVTSQTLELGSAARTSEEVIR